MNAYTKLLSAIAFALFSLILPHHFIQNSATTQVLGNSTPGLPVKLVIPKINIATNIQPVGVTASGDMDVPTNISDVGWFDLGTRPGEKGSAVIAGHVDQTDGKPGVFANLYKLKTGDQIYVENSEGNISAFVVTKTHIYNPGYAEEVYSLNDAAHLNLITCDGIWDGTKKSYTKRLVVFADMK